jgi:hypothetical protein
VFLFVHARAGHAIRQSPTSPSVERYASQLMTCTVLLPRQITLFPTTNHQNRKTKVHVEIGVADLFQKLTGNIFVFHSLFILNDHPKPPANRYHLKTGPRDNVRELKDVARDFATGGQMNVLQPVQRPRRSESGQLKSPPPTWSGLAVLSGFQRFEI